jgi:transcription elongation factor S-II
MASAIVDLKKQLDSTEDAERLHDLLEALGKEKLTMDLLKSTKIGKTVGSSRLRKHDDEKVKGSANKLLKAWKSMAKDSGASTPRGLDSPRAPAADEAPQPTGNKTRDTVRSKFAPLLGGKLGLAAAVEQAMYNKFPLDATMSGKTFRTEDGLGAAQANKNNEQNKKDYLAKFRQLLMNLRKNPELSSGLLGGSLEPATLVGYTALQLQTEQQQETAKKAAKDEFDKKDLNWGERNREKIAIECGIDPNATGVSLCPECESDNTIVAAQMQTRGADEPMTVFFRCNNCKAAWKDDGSNS